MKVALVIERYDGLGGGAERWTDQHARGLLARGLSVHLVARSFREVPEGATLHAVDESPFRKLPRRFRFAAAAEAAIERERFDVVHDMGAGWQADVFMPHHGTRAGGFVQNARFLPAAIRGPWSRLGAMLPRHRQFIELEKRQLASAPKIIALSRMVQQHMQRYHAVPSSKIHVIPNGVDIERFAPPLDQRARSTLRGAWRLDHQTIFLLIAHNFRLKGLGPLIHALASLRRRGADAALVVAGKGNPIWHRKLAAALGCKDAVRFLGDVNDPVGVYQAVDVYVHPTYYDPCSLVLLEAMASGLPTITTRYNGAGELVTPWREGVVLEEPDDIGRLADAMEFYLDEERRRRAGGLARALAERHSLDRNCEEILSLYGAIGRAAAA